MEHMESDKVSIHTDRVPSGVPPTAREACNGRASGLLTLHTIGAQGLREASPHPLTPPSTPGTHPSPR